MSFFQRLANLFSGKPSSQGRNLIIYVLSRRCKEPIEGEVDLYNELSQNDEEGGSGYFTRKVLHTSGARRCFDQVEVSLWFDTNKKLVEHEVTGGTWLEADEYEAELARWEQPPDQAPPSE
jgi:hypothetical protein